MIVYYKSLLDRGRPVIHTVQFSYAE